MHPDVFARLDAVVLTGVIAAAMLVAWLLGSLLGRRQARAAPPKEEVEHASTVAQACLALASLLLAFTFASGYEKYEMRRLQTVDEANAIGTFYRRLALLPDEPRDRAQADVREYVRLHLRAVAAGLQRSERRQIEQQIRVVQERFADFVTRYLRDTPATHLVVNVMPALNAVIDQYEARIAGIAVHLPFAVLLLLVVTSVMGLGLLGWAESLALKSRPESTIAFLLLVSCALYVTFDLDHPFSGMSRVSELPMQRLAESIGASAAE